MTGPTYTCTAWGDPHYTTFGGLVHHLYDKGLYEHARFTIPPCGCEVVIQTFLASLGAASAIAATAVRVGDTSRLPGSEIIQWTRVERGVGCWEEGRAFLSVV